MCHSNPATVPIWLHTYVWPFAIIWPVFLRFYLSADLYDKHIGGQEWTFVWCGIITTVQTLVWLCTHWNVNLRALFTSISAKKVSEAKLIKVIPVTNAGSPEICEIVRDTVGSWNHTLGARTKKSRQEANQTHLSCFRNDVSCTRLKPAVSSLWST